MEFATFKLKAGGDNRYADVVLASSQAKAEEYCQQWFEYSVALEYFELSDQASVSMTFWTRVN